MLQYATVFSYCSMKWIVRKRNQRITNHTTSLTYSLKELHQNNFVIGDSLDPLPCNPLHETEGINSQRTDSSGMSVIVRRVRYACIECIAIRAIGRRP